MPKPSDLVEAPRHSAIIVAAGSSTRMGGKVRKPYLKLRGKPILTWTVAALGKVSGLQQIVLVTRPEDRRRAAAAARLARLPKSIRLDFADGGARRQDSVFNGLKATDARSELILIQDAARPFPKPETMLQACDAARRVGASILACRVKDTVKREAGASADMLPAIQETVPRAGLWLAQTPQIFKRQLILSIFERLMRERPNQEVTDDASICELFGQPVALVESSDTNFKVTRPEDLLIAEAYLKLKMV
ncbi:MAG TPA: 2-C-methyl-D-erythritol 4-phosphate cytidylyltransferase [Planctomycetota bacterium]|nr:2-C-methyl-D-erythritol 4-phosphate cytidylyltransferase [Planctomycetota bacterium]